RCGCNPCACQIRCTEEMLIPTALAMRPAVQCVVSPGGSFAVVATTRSMIPRSSGLRPGGRSAAHWRASVDSAAAASDGPRCGATLAATGQGLADLVSLG